MSVRPKNLTESLVPLITMYALIGHGIFRYPEHRQRPVFSAIYAVIVTVSYLVALALTLDYVFRKPWYGLDERVVFFIIYVNEGIAIFSGFLSWCNAKRFARIIEDLTKVDDTLRELGATFDYARARSEGYGQILVCIVVIVVFNWVDTLWFRNMIPAGQIYIIVSVLHHPVHINGIIAFNFCAGIRHVHLELSKVGKGLNEAYGIQMALEIAALFVMITGLLYEFYILVFRPSAIGRTLRLVVNGIWIFVYFAKLVFINETCERVCTEARRTGVIIHSLDDKYGVSEIHNEIEQFSLQLLQDSVVFSPAGLITLGHRFVKNFLATVTTYLVILIQMTPSEIYKVKGTNRV